MVLLGPLGWLGPFWRDGLEGEGSPVFRRSLSVFSGVSAPRPAPRDPCLAQRPLSALVYAPLLTSSLVGASSRSGCGSLRPRPGDQNFREYSFPGRNHPVDFSELLSYLVLPAKLMERAWGFGLPGSRW